MKKNLALFALFLSLLLPVSAAMAQAKVVRGEGTVAVQGFFSSTPSEEERNTAMQNAKLSAWRSFLAMPGLNEMVDQIRADEKRYLDQLDNLLVDVVVVDENYNKDSKRYTLRIKATVAESVINSMIRASSKSASRGQVGAVGAPTAAGTSIVVLGMAREADVIKSFMTKETRMAEGQADTTSSETSNQQLRGGKGGHNASVNESASVNVKTKTVTGGSREQKRDKISYKVGNVSVLNNKLPRILLQSGIKATQYAFLMRPCKLPNPDTFSKQYAASEQGELSADVMAEIQEKLMNCGRAKFWVFASMDIGGYSTDPNTGLSLVTASVSVQLMEVETGAQLASASKDVSGRSADQSDAMRVATDNAVQAVGDIIAAQIAGIAQ